MRKHKPIEIKKNPRILVTRTDRIGDLLISTPVFKALREKFPESRLAALIFTENRELLQGNPYLDETILYDKAGREKGIWGNLCFALKLAKSKFDIVIHLHATNRMHWAGYLAGIPVRIGWDRKCRWALTHPYQDRKALGEKHEAEYNFKLLEALGIACPGRPELYFPLSAKAESSLSELLFQLDIPQDKPFVVFNPSASCPSKMWPASRFARLAEEMIDQYGINVLLVGSSHDGAVAGKVKKLCPANLYDLSGRLTLSMLGSLLKRATLLISNDTGTAHIASALGTPVISIFGRNQPGLSPVRWRPLGEKSRFIWKNIGCEPCLAHDCRIHFLCLDVIFTDDVMHEAAPFLAHLKLETGSRR